MDSRVEYIRAKINSFRRKYYLGFFIRGATLTLSIILLYILIISMAEYTLWMGRAWRLALLLSLIGGWGLCMLLFLRKPLVWCLYRKGLSHESSAKIIGSVFPSVGDKLLNLVQLMHHKQSSGLLRASIRQKAEALNDTAFDRAVDLNKSKRYLWLLAFPVGVIAILLLTAPSVLTQSANRIVRFDKTFSPPAPFSFHLMTPHLRAFKHEDFTVQVRLEGTSLPAAVYIRSGVQMVKMDALSPSDYAYTFKKVNASIPFRFESEGLYSDSMLVRLIYRPELVRLKVELDFPGYLSRQNETLSNTGNLEVPEGTRVLWEIGTLHATTAKMGFSFSGKENPIRSAGNHRFIHRASIQYPGTYWITLENDQDKNKDSIAYRIDVIKDQYPQLLVDRLADSTTFRFLLLGGRISDDHGLTTLSLHHRAIRRSGKEEKLKKVFIPIQKDQQLQSFTYTWFLDSLEEGDKISYFLEVRDNDQVNGPKSTRSAVYTFMRPGETSIRDNITQSQKNADNQLQHSIDEVRSLQEKTERAREKLRGKQSVNWTEKAFLEEILKQKDSVYKAIDQLQQQHKQLNEKREVLLEQDKSVIEKTQQIQKLMEDLLDEKTKALFEELQQLLKENSKPDNIKDLLDKIDRKEGGIAQALERMLELLNQLKFDLNLDETLHQLNKQIMQQKELLDKTQQAGKRSANHRKKGAQKPNSDNAKTQNGAKKTSSLAEEQQDLVEKSKPLKQAMTKLEKANKQIRRNHSIPVPKDIDEVRDYQQKSQQSLQQQDHKTATQWQQKSLGKMEHIKSRLEALRQTRQMKLTQENIALLRHILHGLIGLSHNQESLIDNFRNVPTVDPRYVTLSQRQFKLKNDFKVQKDSLLHLAKKDPFISAAIMREVGELDYHLDKALEYIRERKRGNDQSEMQWSMTKINNLALLLDDHLNMLMQAQAGSGPGNKLPQLSELQKKLNQQIMELKKSGKTGRPLSEELAKMAAEQERIRHALQKMEEKLKQRGGKMPGSNLAEKMEETEIDLLKKSISEQTIRRQQEILTRLLDVEKSIRKQGLEEERQGTTAKEYQKNLPKIFEEYINSRQKEVELLNTVPPELNPYYKKEVNQYFRRIKNH